MAYQARLFSTLFPHLAARPTITDGPQDNGLWVDNWSNTPDEIPNQDASEAYSPMGTADNTTVDQPVTQPPTSDVKGRTTKVDERPTFQLPYPEPANNYESAQNALASGRDAYLHPVNKDKGVKGMLKDIFSNVRNAGQFIRPGMGLGESLAVLGAGAAGGAIDRTANEKREAAKNLPLLEESAQMAGQERDKQVKWETTRRDDDRLDKAAKDLSDWRTSETARKISDSQARERTSRMTTVAGMFKNIPAYDPNDPKFKELTEALGDVGLPLTPKDVKKKVDLKQDQRTGAWTLILTDPISGKQESRDVVKDGKPFASTPTVVMQGEYGMLKQDDQQRHDTEEKAKDRAVQIQKIQEDIRQFSETSKLNWARLDQAIKSGDATAQRQMDALKASVVGRKAWINANIVDPDEKAALLAELPDIK